MTPPSALRELYACALRAAAPGPAVTAALDAEPCGDGPVHIMAIGKASHGMAAAAVAWLASVGRTLAGGIIVGAEDVPAPPGSRLAAATGDHPSPGRGSAHASALIARAAARVGAADTVLVLLSGGASSLAAAPLPGVSSADLVTLNDLLLSSGLDIHDVNLIRKRVLQWGAGRLAMALHPARVCCLAISDVPGSAIASIGSGPCSPDPAAAGDVIQRLRDAQLWSGIPPSIRSALEQTAGGLRPETPKPGDPRFDAVRARIILDNTAALAAVTARAAALGLHVTAGAPLAGEASFAGASIGRSLRQMAPDRCFVRGGETTVTLGGGPHGHGGRCQELALAAAREIEGADRIALLAAGTDGRDGPTDAAGALVDAATWSRISMAGRDPAADLARHASYEALDVAEALLRTGPTGTNVGDIVIAVS